MAEPKWLKGELTGNCVGRPHRKVGGSGLARWYKLELLDAVVANWQPVAGPPKAGEGPTPFCQAKLRDARLRSPTPGGTDEELSLRELSVWNWKMRDQREGGGESRCTLVGTVYAMEVAGTRRPALGDDADRLDRWGCLGLLLVVLTASWLWWSCGPFTCGLWSTVVATSWWTHRLRTRRRTPPGVASQILQSVLALVLITGGVGLVIGLRDPARATVCGETSSLAVLAALGEVVAGSLLTIAWPRWWIWALWTAVVALWCGRTGSDCAGQWLQRARAAVVGSARPSGEPGKGWPLAPGGSGRTTPEETPKSSGVDGGGAASASGATGTGSGGTGTGSGGTGPGSGGTGAGSSGTGAGSSGTGTGSGATGTDSGDTGPGSGSTGTGSGGTGSGGTSTGSTTSGSGGTTSGSGDTTSGSGGTGSGSATISVDGSDTPEAANEPRMSVDSALSDPKPFFDGSTRVTLNGDLLFSFDEDQLRPEAEPKLRQVARLMRLDPSVRVLLEGHSDTIGGDQYNQELSERRAQAVRAWLVEQAHINPAQIDVVGYGSSKPIVPASKSPTEQAPNRRVEVRVLPR